MEKIEMIKFRKFTIKTDKNNEVEINPRWVKNIVIKDDDIKIWLFDGETYIVERDWYFYPEWINLLHYLKKTWIL